MLGQLWNMPTSMVLRERLEKMQMMMEKMQKKAFQIILPYDCFRTLIQRCLSDP